MTRSDQISEISAALAKAQGEMTSPPKDKTARVEKKPGVYYEYTYADIATVIEAVKPVLAKNSLAVSQQMSVTDGTFGLHTLLVHCSGQFFSSFMPLPRERSPQELGAYLTYFRRYALCAILGIAADEDDDAQGVKAPSAAEEPHVRQVAQGPRPEGKPSFRAPGPQAASAPKCEKCGTELKLSKEGRSFYCPKFTDKSRGEHTWRPAPRSA